MEGDMESIPSKPQKHWWWGKGKGLESRDEEEVKSTGLQCWVGKTRDVLLE